MTFSVLGEGALGLVLKLRGCRAAEEALVEGAEFTWSNGGAYAGAAADVEAAPSASASASATACLYGSSGSRTDATTWESGSA